MCSIVACVLAFAATILLTLFPGWQAELDEAGNEIEVKPLPSRNLLNLILAVMGAVNLASTTGLLWQHCAAVAATSSIESATGHNIKVVTGTTALVLGWTSVALWAVATLGMVPTVISVRALNRVE